MPDAAGAARNFTTVDELAATGDFVVVPLGVRLRHDVAVDRLFVCSARMRPMERVTGIGGVFFKGDDPGMLARWYEQHLGVLGVGESYDDPVWMQDRGPTVFAPFGPEHWDSAHLGPTGWGINFRVDDIDAMVRQLRGNGVEVDVDPEVYPNGRFAQLADPEGNPIQLWEPK